MGYILNQCFFFFAMLGVRPKALSVLGKHPLLSY